VPNLNLDTLKNNGGLTPTIALGSGSAALNAGLANCPTSDQRGFPRPSANKCDIGAYQYNFGDGSVACTKQMLNQALKVGGYIPIFCPPNTTITVTSDPDTATNYRSIATPTTLDASASTGFTLSGDNNYQLFAVNSDFTIKNLTITNSKSKYTYAIFNNGILNVTNCTFSYNTGAILNKGNIPVIDHSSFVSNSSSSYFAWKGVIVNASTIGTISNSSFISNSYANGGGAVINNGKKINSITNSSFLYNSSTLGGGAIYNANSSTSLTNSAGTITTISNSIFNSNIGNSGGAIYNGGSIDTISGTTFLSNSASSKGGAIYTDTSIDTISGTTFSSNSASSAGGAIYSSRSVNLLSSEPNGSIDHLIGSTFTNNYVFQGSGNGGAIYNEGRLKDINNTSFTSNIGASSATSGSGGAIYNSGESSNTIISNSSFDANSASYQGGAISNNDSAQLTITNSTFSSNSATNGKGGAIVNDTNGSVAITNATFVSSSSSSGDYGGLYNIAGTINIKNSLLATRSDNSNGYNCSGSITDLGFNLSNDPSCNFGNTTSLNNITALQSKLDSLQNNGGATPTIALLPGNPAIGLVASGCPAIDQRGKTRATTNCDAGAYETTNKIILKSSISSAVYGQSVTFTASVTTVTPGAAIPSGTVSFSDNGTTLLGNVTLSGGTANFSTSSLGAGPHVITATYNGDTNYGPMYATSSVNIDKATPTITFTSASDYTYDGNPHPATATVSGVGGVAVAGTLKYSYSPGESAEPVKRGAYIVTVTFTSTDPNYSNATGITTITIY
jgi:predicted outer membrane repeat protein